MVNMITSKELIERCGISRATLNNYISLGFIPKPEVYSPKGNDIKTIKRIGYFEDNVLSRIEEIKQLKKEGFGITQLINHYKEKGLLVKEKKAVDGNITLSLDSIDCPSVMINYNFEIVWLNQQIKELIWKNRLELDDNTSQRNIFDVLGQSKSHLNEESIDSLYSLFVKLAKTKYSRTQLEATVIDKSTRLLNIFSTIYADNDELHANKGILLSQIKISSSNGSSQFYQVAVTSFREGMLLVFIPDVEQSESIINYLSRRDLVIRELLKNKIPTFTSFAVLVTDLQSSTRICAELPANEYFQLINEIWSSLDPIFRQFYGTHGKHVGDGMVYYFFPKPDSSYTFNAVQCAMMIKDQMKKINEKWRIKKGWLRDLYLNTAIHEGQEWLGTFQTANSIEFTVLGDTINQVARVCDFARFGAVWASKKLMSQLTNTEINRIQYGINRIDNNNQPIFIPNTYAQIDTLLDLSSPKYEKLREIATLSVTEIKTIV